MQNMLTTKVAWVSAPNAHVNSSNAPSKTPQNPAP